MFRKLLLMMVLSASAAFLGGTAWAGSQDVIVKNAWASETVPGQTKVSVQLDLTCTAGTGKLVAVESPLAESGGIQRVWAVHGKTTTQPVAAVPLRRGRAVAFRENGMSIVLQGLKQPLKVGDVLPLTLTVLTGGKKVEVEVRAEVKADELSYKRYQEVEKQRQE